MKIIVLILCVFFTTSKAFAQEQVKTTYIKDGKTYTNYHDYYVFDMPYLLAEQKVTKISEGYWKHKSFYEMSRTDPTVREAIDILNSGKGGLVHSYTHYLSIMHKDFQGDVYSGYNIPFVGQCTKQIKFIIINGIRHKIENNDDIYFRQLIKLKMGYNRVYVDVELSNGIRLKGQYLEINVVNINKGYDINIK